MVTFNQGNTQVYSPFGSIVVEQRDRGFQYPRVSAVPEPMPAPAGNAPRPEQDLPVKAAA